MALGAAVAGILGPRVRVRDPLPGVGRPAAPRNVHRRPGMTVSKCCSAWWPPAPVGVVVVDRLRDVVVSNERATRTPDWCVRACSTIVCGPPRRPPWRGEDVAVDLHRRGRWDRAQQRVGARIRTAAQFGQSRLAVIYLDDQSEQARMEASRATSLLERQPRTQDAGRGDGCARRGAPGIRR